MKQVTTQQLLVDGLAVAAVSLGITLVSHRPTVMWAVLLSVLVIRFIAWARLNPGRSLRVELAFFALCVLLGGFNDWNTVVVHHVYAYAVPAELPRLSTIPIWMLVFWGLILRLIFALTRWRRLGPPEEPVSRVLHRRSPTLKILSIAIVVLATRLSIFTHFESALWSWLPFALGLVAYAFMTRIDRHDLRLATIALVVGPLAEVLYIQVGSLHAYALGWFAGVPLWIVLWWVLSVWIWKDLGLRAHALIERVVAARDTSQLSTQKRWMS